MDLLKSKIDEVAPSVEYDSSSITIEKGNPRLKNILFKIAKRKGKAANAQIIESCGGFDMVLYFKDDSPSRPKTVQEIAMQLRTEANELAMAELRTQKALDILEKHSFVSRWDGGLNIHYVLPDEDVKTISINVDDPRKIWLSSFVDPFIKLTNDLRAEREALFKSSEFNQVFEHDVKLAEIEMMDSELIGFYMDAARITVIDDT